jgi:hypothetical protein
LRFGFFFLVMGKNVEKRLFVFKLYFSLSLSLCAPRSLARDLFFAARIIVGDFDDERTKRKAKMMILLRARPPDDAERRTTE